MRKHERAPGKGELGPYDRARIALTEAKSVDEVKDIRDQAVAMAPYARQAKNRDLEADAVEIRMRATRRLDQMRQAQRDSVGLNRGAAAGGGKNGPRGLLINPRDLRPTLASQGIDKSLAQQARVLGALTDQKFEEAIAAGRASAKRTMRRVINGVAIEQERERHRARIQHGGRVTDLIALAASGFRAGVIAPDPAWPFAVYSEQGRQRSPDAHYDTMSLDEIKALPIASLAADDCALVLWGVWPELPGILDVIQAWGFEYKTVEFVWVKLNPDGNGLFTGMGFHTRSNTEFALIATRGNPLRLAADVHQVIMAPVGEHSAKPDEAYTRMERLYGGPYLELFARKPREGWRYWGNEIERETWGAKADAPAPPQPSATAATALVNGGRS
jgi:N6-adenosine-specific RNA methylase IME4